MTTLAEAAGSGPMTEPSVELVPVATGMAPMSVEDAKQAMEQYREICAALLDSDDMQRVNDREFVKRSGFQKLAAAYAVSTEVKSLTTGIETRLDGNGDEVRVWVARAIVRATHPSGRRAEGDGACSTGESRFARGSQKIDHDLPATAVTRATNRAVSNLVAYGSVSAEEAEQGGTGTASSGPAGKTPAWAAPMTDIPGVAQALVRVLQAAGVDEPGKKAMAIGEEIFNLCEESFPFALARLADLLVRAAETATPAQRAAAAMAEDFDRAAAEDKIAEADEVAADQTTNNE